jgi:hypothetical protein
MNPLLIGSIVRTQGQVALKRKYWDAAEAYSRKAVAIFLAGGQDKTSHIVMATRSELGMALVGLHRYSEAEPLLLNFLGRANASERNRAIENVVQLYHEWGKADKEAEYREHLVGQPQLGPSKAPQKEAH